MHYEVSTSELSTLYTLAAQCPYIYGTAVYQARNLLVLADSNYAPTLTPCELGYQNGTAKTDAPPGDAANRQSSMQLVNQLHVFPNPASQQIMVMFESDKHRAGTIQITSVTGHLVFELCLPYV